MTSNNNSVLQKYKDMAKIRDDFNTINPDNFMLPTMGEMVQEDLMAEILQDFIDNKDVESLEQGILDESFYTETPFSTALGYHPQESVFILNARALAEDTNDWILNKIDGDTTYYKIEDIDDGNQPFTFTNRMKYNSFKDYYQKMNGSPELTIRHLGLNTPELPHFEVQAVPKGSDKWQTMEMTFKEVKELSKKNRTVTYLKHPVNKDKNKLVERKDSDIVKLLKIKDDKGKIAYKEIVNKKLVPWMEPTITNKNSNYDYLPIVVEDDSTAGGIIDGYNCQKTIKEVLGSATDILLMINANGINFGRKAPLSQMTFNSLFYLDDTIDFMLTEWKKSFGDIHETNYTYKPYGTDTYGRSLGAIYVKQVVKGESRWINLNKMVLAKSTHSEANPSYNSSPELEAIGAGISEAFKRWSYDKDNIEYMDSFSNLTANSYKKRLDLHKKLTGIDFTQSRNCALMIGDTMMLVPPESIRNITQVFYERVPNMRSKGTMTKQIGQNEQMLEITLYFYEDSGINGIPYQITTPSGDKLTYYMNGLRSLLAQFKVTPYLPIENGYINDVLGIEAVSMQNINVQTVEGFPRLLKVVLNLREFNYRTFMPDLPVDDKDPEDTTAISELTPMFAKCFNWEIFRYYYQRGIMEGELLKQLPFASYDYNLQFYTNKNTLQPFDFCSPPGMGSKISFYIPDEIWLQNALQVKKERDANLYTDTSYVSLSDNAKRFCGRLSTLFKRIKSANAVADNTNQTNDPNTFRAAIDDLFEHSDTMRANIPMFTAFNTIKDDTPYGEKRCVKRRSISEVNGEDTMIFFDRDPNNNYEAHLNKKQVKEKIMNIRNTFFDKINDSSYLTGMAVDELVCWNPDNKTYDIYWDFNISLNTTSLTDDDIRDIKEALAKNINQNEMKITIDKIFKENKVRIRYKMSFTPPSGHRLPSDANDNLIGNVIAELLTGSPGTSDTNTNSLQLESNDYDYIALQQIEQVINEEVEEGEENKSNVVSNATNEAIDFYVKDYKNPANMPFVPYLENVSVSVMSANMSNTFTEISLKAVEGVGPQFLGGQDSVIEIQMMTDDIVTVSMLNNLPLMASATAKKYRRVLPAWPLKIRSEFTGLISVSEVLIDAIEVDTVEGFPGVYSISMRLTSVDRTQRQREALRRLDVKPTGGNVDVESSNLAINKYFAIESALSQAELYPDLDLPTLDDMAKLGWKFVKYTGQNRIYPDPDFYITYAYPYSSLIIKKSLKDVLSKQLLSKDGKQEVQSFKFSDVMGASVTGKVEAVFGIDVTEENSIARNYEKILQQHKKMIEKKALDANWSEDKKKKVTESAEEISIINYLTMCDIADGWEIKPGLKAPLCDESTNEAIKNLHMEKNLYAKSIKEKRARAIELINKIIDGPINYKDGSGDEKVATSNYQTVSERAVNEIFINNKYGRELIELLCPSLKIEKLKASYGISNTPKDHMTLYDNKFTEKYFRKLNPLAYLAGFVFAAGCALSGSEEYKSDAKENRWHPNHYSNSTDIASYTYAQDKDEYPNTKMPYIEQERYQGSNKMATRISDGIKAGVTFGAWRIRQYSIEEISKIMIRDDRSIVYKSDYYDEIYRDKFADNDSNQFIQDGYLDPYYNLHMKTGDTIQKYNKAIALSKEANAEAFIRVVLTHLKKMILDGLFFSEIDVVLEDFSYFYDKYITDNALPMIPTGGVQPTMTSDAQAELSALGIDAQDMSTLVLEIQKSFEKSLCARLIYPFLVAVSEGDPKVYGLLKSRDYNALSSLTGYVVDSSQTTESTGKIYKFVSALAGCNMTLKNDNSNEATASVSQQLMNNMMKDIYLAAADDPRAYLLHSFYDMLVNDKRGRLVRAFPTYYVIFIDEGRKIGSWKLHDNFYNMNSISDIQVVKSRKIAADTCTITMNNMFNSYTTESDITTTQQYMDMYGLKDVFASIFTPESYFEKEKALRLRQTLPDKVQLQPGVRIHVRMGYSGDGSKLPVVFNGKIAEVEIGSVAQIIAQGDGHELMNPLNAFGEIEVTSLDPAQSMVTWFKDLRGSLAKGGETPRDLLAKLLTAKHGGWKKVANDAFDGRWFNDNPFGIMHFGDPRYNHIFGLGEPVQNLYEVSDANLLKGMNELASSKESKKTTPIINTSLQDKTLWDILHLCANSGLGYIGAIRDFGFRSTVFLGKPNHYYAYEYAMVDNKVVEKRKPFQQFHYYDSYNDIIYNAIKASESQMKTNAVGIWQASSPWWGREQSTVGPIYLDMNIYPEYQKSMTVDTGLLADGNGGIDIPFISHLSERWAMDANDDKVNKALAWRVTANALRDSVKDMYQGDVGIIGDPSVKPHDRVYIYDTYEDIQGMFEVEAVVHSMSVANGFTTSIMPDVIARHQDEMEPAAQGLLNTIASTLKISMSSYVAHTLWTASVNNKLAVSLAKSKTMYGATKKLMEHAKNMSTATGMGEYLDSHPATKQLFENLNFIPSENNIDLNRFTYLIDDLASGNLTTLSDSFDDFVKLFGKFNDFDADAFEKAMIETYKADKYKIASSHTEDDIKKATKEMKETFSSLQSKLNYGLEKVDLKEFADQIHGLKISDTIINQKTKNVLETLASGVELDNATKSKYISILLDDENIAKHLKDPKGKLKLNGLNDIFDDFKGILLGADDGLKAPSILKALKGGDVIDDLLAVVIRVAKLNWASVLLDLTIGLGIEIFTRNTKEMFTRWLQSIQAIDVYPLKRFGKPLIAGMNGHKGSVAMYPVNDGYNSIQGMILEVVESIKGMNSKVLPFFKWGDMLLEMFVDTNILSTLSKDWRSDLGLIDPDVDETSKDPKHDKTKEDFNQEVYNEISAGYSNRANSAYSLMTKNRIKSYDTKKGTDPTYKHYEIKGVSASSLITNEKVRNLYYLEKDDVIKKAISEDKLVIAHNKSYNSFANIQFEYGNERVPVVINSSNNVIDTPLVQEEVVHIMQRLVNEKSLGGKIHFKSGARFNDTRTWRNTGFSFILEYQGRDKKLKEALDKVREDTAYIENVDDNKKRYMFSYKEYDETSDYEGSGHGNRYVIIVYAPTYDTELKSYKKNKKGEK